MCKVIKRPGLLKKHAQFERGCHFDRSVVPEKHFDQVLDTRQSSLKAKQGRV